MIQGGYSLKNLKFDDSLCKGKSAFNRMAKLQNDIIDSDSADDAVTLLINLEGRTGLTFVFLLSCLPILAKSKNKTVFVRANEPLFKLMKKINAVDYYSCAKDKDKIFKIIEKPCFRPIECPEDIFKLVNDIGGEAPIKMSEELTDIMVSKMGEMYINALGHSKATYIIGGKYFKQQNRKYCFSCYDTGMGIPKCVNEHFGKIGHSLVTDEVALKWAMVMGNTTNPQKGVSNGVGLYTLKSFAKANDGVIRICSGHSLYIYSKGTEKYYV